MKIVALVIGAGLGLAACNGGASNAADANVGADNLSDSGFDTKNLAVANISAVDGAVPLDDAAGNTVVPDAVPNGSDNAAAIAGNTAG